MDEGSWSGFRGGTILEKPGCGSENVNLALLEGAMDEGAAEARGGGRVGGKGSEPPASGTHKGRNSKSDPACHLAVMC